MAIVGLDVGTSGVKGVAVDAAGGVLAVAARRYGPDMPRPGWSEQDPDTWWRASEAVLGSLAAEVGAPEAIGLSGQMHGLVALDGHDRPLRPAILWNDGRSEAQCAQIERILGREELVRLTGNRAVAGFTAPKLMWMREHESDLFARIRTVLLPKDYVRLRLCGERAQDVSDASGTLLFDVGARCWSQTVLDALEIPAQWLPPVLESATQVGVTAAGTPVLAGAGDQAAGALGVGVMAPGSASIVLGTSGVVFSPLERYRPDVEGRTHTFCHAAPDLWHAMGVMLSAAGSLEWLRSVIAPEISFDALLLEAARWPAGTEGLVFLPYLAGERTPHADAGARGSFSGLSLRHDRGALVRAVLEGVCCGLRDSLDLLRQAGASVDAGVVSGGGAASDLWLGIAASVLAIPLARTRTHDAAAYGAALLAGVGAGMWDGPGAAAAATVSLSDPVEPDPDAAERYATLQGTYRRLYPAIATAVPPPKGTTR